MPNKFHIFTAEQSKIALAHNHECMLGRILGASTFGQANLHGHGLAKSQMVKQAADLLHFGVPVGVRQGLGWRVHRAFPENRGRMSWSIQGVCCSPKKGARLSTGLGMRLCILLVSSCILQMESRCVRTHCRLCLPTIAVWAALSYHCKSAIPGRDASDAGFVQQSQTNMLVT